MSSNFGGFLVDINAFLSEFRELQSILEGYQVTSVSKLKKKIDNREIPERPSYEDYLDAIHLLDLLKSKQNSIIRTIEGFELDKLK